MRLRVNRLEWKVVDDEIILLGISSAAHQKRPIEAAIGGGGGKVLVRLQIPEGVVFEILEDQTVVLDLKGGKYFALNRTGTRVWELIQLFHDRAEIEAILVEEFAQEPAVIQRDLDKLIEGLQERGLLSVETD